MTTRRAALPVIFFVSGAAALLFETLWFRLTGLTFGNTAWASAIVLTSFMAGLALGNLLALRLRGTLRTYAAIEAVVALSGFALVFALPATQATFAPLFRALPLDATRLVLAFVLLVIPTTAMGATLPTVVRALSDDDPNFGRVLGVLYGCNTLGAVAGSLLGELVLIRAVGIRGTGVVAGCLSLLAAGAALAMNQGERVALTEGKGRVRGASRFYAATFLSGFALLALEVLWFRLIVLFNFGSSLAFALMLAVVLAGISAGALAAGAAMSRWPGADEWSPVVAAIASIGVVVAYAGFSHLNAPPEAEAIVVFADAVRLMLPVSAISGFLFTTIGRAVERRIGEERRATALLTCWNTVGAAIGSALAAFVFIPYLGVERAFFLIAVVYILVALLTATRRAAAAIVLAAIALVFFPFGLMRSTFLPQSMRSYLGPHQEVVAVREGVTENAAYIRGEYHGEPWFHRLVTNGYSMSSTAMRARRYMDLFVHLPVALRPQIRSALLISYGVGSTAKSLTSTRQLASIDVVDISRNILELGAIAWPGAENPLRDRRVRVHLEDGRFFLLTTPRRFDLITGEPPPPKAAGINSLYSLEYFRLMRDRLNDGGIASYWLPVYQLDAQEARAIAGAFCGAFRDCSLWSGGGQEWILIGTPGGRAPNAEEWSRQFRDPVIAPRMAALGIETPEQLAATFLADADQLRQFIGPAEPLTDDHPLRLSSRTTMASAPEFASLLRSGRKNFATSRYAATAIPREIRANAQTALIAEGIVDEHFAYSNLGRPAVVRGVLTHTPFRELPRILLNVDPALEVIAQRAHARGDRTRDVAYILGAGALGDRDYARAATLFDEASRGGDARAAQWRDLARELAPK